MRLFPALLLVAPLLAAAKTSKPVPSPSPSPAASFDIASTQNAFAADLYRTLAADPQNKGNLFFSPNSVAVALTMTLGGARGQTASEMATALHLDPANLGPAHDAIGALLAELNGDGKDRGYQLAAANAIWTAKDLALEPSFSSLVSGRYGASIRGLDFLGAPEPSRKTINDWVEDRTQKKIKDLLPQGSINHETRLVLTNAIYFKGKWAEEFDPKSTRPAPFHLDGGKTVDVPTMVRSGHLRFANAPEAALLELPYKGDALSMIVVLPPEGGLAALEKGLTAEKLASWSALLARGYTPEVDLALPKLHIEKSYSLNEPLQKLGMREAFSNGDFSGMFQSPAELAISSVVHKAFVDVNEEGTEAAAATGIVIGITSVEMPVTFHADHPFLFLIRHERTGAVLFMGRVTNPKAAP